MSKGEANLLDGTLGSPHSIEGRNLIYNHVINAPIEKSVTGIMMALKLPQHGIVRFPPSVSGHP